MKSELWKENEDVCIAKTISHREVPFLQVGENDAQSWYEQECNVYWVHRAVLSSEDEKKAFRGLVIALSETMMTWWALHVEGKGHNRAGD
jgi:hypothetical protein